MSKSRKFRFFKGIPTIKYFSTSGYKVYIDTKYIILKLRIWYSWSTYGFISRTSKRRSKSRFKLGVSGQNRHNSNFGPCRIFSGQTVRDIAKRFSLALSAYAILLLPVHFDTISGLMFWKNRLFGYESCQISRFRWFWTLSDFSWPNGKRYRQTVFFGVISV